MTINQFISIALQDLNNNHYPYLEVNNWDDVSNNPVLARMSKLVGKYGIHIAKSPDIVINLTGRELVEYLDCHTRQPSAEGYFANMLTGSQTLI